MLEGARQLLKSIYLPFDLNKPDFSSHIRVRGIRVWGCRWGAVPLWLVVWRHRVRWTETQVFSFTAKLDVPGSTAGPAPAQDLQRHDQYLNHRLPRGREAGGPASSKPPAAAPDPALGLHCMLWQQIKQLSHSRHASPQTDLHISSYITVIIYPPQPSSGAPCHKHTQVQATSRLYISTDGYCQIM